MKSVSLYFMFLFSMEGVFGETKLVNEGESVTLLPHLTEIKKDDVIDWRFEKILIARVKNNNNPTTYDDEPDGKFRGRLELNGQTGDLTITNIKTSDSGVYEITNSINTFRKTFNVSVHSGLSPAEIAGIVVGVGALLVFVAAVGVICYKKKRQVL